MISQYFCNTGLTLGSTSLDHHNPDQHHLRNRDERKSSLRFDHAIPSLTLGLFSSEEEKRRVSDTVLLHRQVSHSISATSSYSNNSSVKRERDGGGEEAEGERERCSKVGGDHDQDLEEGSAARKKLRLSKEQSVVLEDRFKEHSSLNPLKQTEVECEVLRKCCDTLTDENKRLRNEIQELKALKKTAPPFYMQLPAVATLTVCPSCERDNGGGGGKENSSKNLFSIGAKSHFYNSFTHPSAAF
ncbi:hypothetical protein RHGRI_021693 [Rhododendron griersonianum]|uniref:Leucine zipper homeobox-associated domain-containing protein n=1 Tax=Rhododendron griersonianum TaxID=479676 RepID=A0AAV6JL70_9ERIC|nr:hypothetical protein RHGRI_021693 [Rhododendron griersonianum]